MAGRWLFVSSTILCLVLSSDAAGPPVCGRAGGVIRGQEAELGPRVAAYESEEMCEQRSCAWDKATSTCHYPGHASAKNITTVHLIQSNHLDVGGTSSHEVNGVKQV